MLCRSAGASTLGNPADRVRDSDGHGRIENTWHDEGWVQSVRFNNVCDGAGGGEQHVVADRVGMCIEQTTEHTRECQHIVDLVGIVASAGRNDSGMLLRLNRI